MSETRLKEKVVAMLRRNYPGIFFYKAADKFQSGIPDLIGCYKGRFFGLELKFGVNRATRLQEHVLQKIRAAGGMAGVAYNIEDVKNILEGGEKHARNIN
jgi:hypothetical protein